jgi:2-polyprenyl-3-methyl-5-hydroxy-6-metoxy-1,4-benzoquinol methylase
MGLYEEFAEYYDLIYKEIVNYEKETDDLEKIFAEFYKKKPKSILDVGCGTGSHSLILSTRGYSVTGIDISERMIEEAMRFPDADESLSVLWNSTCNLGERHRRNQPEDQLKTHPHY